MSETEPETQTTGGVTFEGTDDYDDRPLRERFAENPRPALVWVGVLLVLLAVELGRFMGGVLGVGRALEVGLEVFGVIPGWIGGNVASTLGGPAGTLVAAGVTVVLVYVLASALSWLVFKRRLAQRTGVVEGRRRESRFERLVVTGVLSVLVALLVVTPVGAAVDGGIAALVGGLEWLVENWPTLTSRDTIPNQGHQLPGGGWEGTFMGLSPAAAWALRVALVFVYVFVLVAWLWRGFNVWRTHYREADWTPRDDSVRRFRGHLWGLFGLTVVIAFVTMAAWAPAIAPVPIQDNVYQPYQNEFEFLNEESGEVESILHGTANLETRSNGQNTVSPLTYDQYGRYHPLGTTPRGQDLLTNLAYGARTSLIIGLLAVGLGGFIAVALSLITAYYKGIADLLVVVTSDTIISIPAFLLVMLLSVLFSDGNHPLAEPLDGGMLLALIFAFAFWPGMWRSIRGPSLQVAEEEWVDAAKSYGQTPVNTMRKHMAPYIAAYIIIYSSLLLGSIIIITAALSFLGLGISAPTPEWGRIINGGQPYVATSSWHVATVSGLMIVAVVTAFNALGDALRDVIDPESDVDTAAGGGA